MNHYSLVTAQDTASHPWAKLPKRQHLCRKLDVVGSRYLAGKHQAIVAYQFPLLSQMYNLSPVKPSIIVPSQLSRNSIEVTLSYLVISELPYFLQRP